VFKVCYWPNPVIARIVHRSPEALGDSLIRPAGTLSKGVSERPVKFWRVCRGGRIAVSPLVVRVTGNAYTCRYIMKKGLRGVLVSPCFIW
jgi:hypothetical protein